MVTLFLLFMVLMIIYFRAEEENKVTKICFWCGWLAFALLVSHGTLVYKSEQSLGSFTLVENESISKMICDQYATDGEDLYQFSLGRGAWIPFLAGSYEKCEAPAGYCSDCQKIWGSNFCKDCGKDLGYTINRCNKCGQFCDTTYCGACGAKRESE